MSDRSIVLDRNLALEAVRVTEAAALPASRLMGRGDEKAADQAAVDAMRTRAERLTIEGKIVIGEGERDEAPMLYIGEKVGSGNGPRSTSRSTRWKARRMTAKGVANALAVMAMAEQGGFLNAPDVYMDKIAVGAGLPDGVVDLDAEPADNMQNLAKAKRMRDRGPRRLHPRPSAPCRADRRGARGRRAHHADHRRRRRRRDRDRPTRTPASTSISARAARRRACWPRRRLRCIGGQIQGRLVFRNDDERGRAREMRHQGSRTANTACTISPRAT